MSGGGVILCLRRNDGVGVMSFIYHTGISHLERVEVTYDPDTFEAELVEVSEPVVTAWDRTPPASAERPVGAWSVTPDADGVVFDERDAVDLESPADLQERMKQDAAVTGERVSEPLLVEVRHDLDSQQTDTSAGSRARITGRRFRNTGRGARGRVHVVSTGRRDG